MNATRITGALTATLLFAASGAFAQEAQDHAGHGEMEMQGASGAYMAAMERMDSAMSTMEMTGDPSVDFATMMIPHHQSAVDMAEAYIESEEQDPELTELAREIVASQEAEIKTLESWLDENQP